MRRLVLHERERECDREMGQMYINRSCLKQLSKVKDYNFSPEKKRNTIHGIQYVICRLYGQTFL